MHTEYHQWHSDRLGQNMELKVYGHSGKPLLVFPSQGGRFHEYEDQGMIGVLAGFIEDGLIKIFAVDSIDNQSWANWGSHPSQRVRRHETYEQYITHEVLPFIYYHSSCSDRLMVTGCSMGGYHAANYFFRHPHICATLIAISAPFQLDYFIGDYMDESVYFHTPLAYLANLQDPWYLDHYHQNDIIVAVGQGEWEESLAEDARKLEQILASKQVPAWIDFWGHDVSHDWHWWLKMVPYFLGEVLKEE